MKLYLVVWAVFSVTTLPAQLCESTPLNGPWKFHTGDHPGWSDPGFDDSGWETVDLTPKAGAHDSDVGLTGYVPGWAAKGHKGYDGFAWYRLSVSADSLKKMAFLCGPTDVDDAYQLYLDGKLLGGIGDFSAATPVVYSIQPHLFDLSGTFKGAPLINQRHILAFRVWVSPRTVSEADDAGGIHVAPILAAQNAAQIIYHKQWQQTFWGYVVDAVEPAIFVVLALVALFLARGRSATAFKWTAAALTITALVRASQVFYYWGQWESLKVYYFSKEILFTPLSLGAWAIAWYLLLGGKQKWPFATALVLTLAYLFFQLMGCGWQFEQAHPQAAVFNALAGYISLAFILLMAGIMSMGLHKSGVKAGWIVLAMLLLCTGLFAGELSRLGVPGIWFPFGVGVSRTQYVYAAFDVLLLIILLQHPRRKPV
jgi:hypothetical protein